MRKNPYWRGSRAKTLEYYWQDFLEAGALNSKIQYTEPAFWDWYASERGPFGVHLALRWYSRSWK